MRQVDVGTVEVVGPEGTARAAFLPCRAEHEMIDEQLAPALEQIRKGLPAVRALELVVPVNQHPGQAPPLGRQFVPETGQLLLLVEQRNPRLEPVFPRNDLVIRHARFPLHPGGSLDHSFGGCRGGPARAGTVNQALPKRCDPSIV